MRELEDPLERLNTFQPFLVNLFQIGADGFVKYMISPYPSEEDVINVASKKTRSAPRIDRMGQEIFFVRLMR